MAAIESIYGPYSYSTLIDSIGKANKEENKGIAKPSLPVWVKSQKVYEKRADELANAHAEQCRQYAASNMKNKAKTTKQLKLEKEQKQPEQTKSLAIANELEKDLQTSSTQPQIIVNSREKDLLIAIAELYLENKAMRQSS